MILHIIITLAAIAGVQRLTKAGRNKDKVRRVEKLFEENSRVSREHFNLNETSALQKRIIATLIAGLTLTLLLLWLHFHYK